MIAMNSRDKQANKAWGKLAADMDTTPAADETLPDYDELIDLYNNLRGLVHDLKSQNATLRDENYQLRTRNAKSKIKSSREKLLEAENERLRAELAAVQRESSLAGWKGQTHNNRPVITVAAAAKQTGCHLSTCYRYCASGWWQSFQDGASWLIYADQPLNTKPRGRRKKGNQNA